MNKVLPIILPLLILTLHGNSQDKNIPQYEKMFRIVEYDYATNYDLRSFDMFYVEQTPSIFVQGYNEIGYSEITFKIYKIETDLKTNKELSKKLIGEKSYSTNKGRALNIPFRKLEAGDYKVDLLFLDRVKETKYFTVSEVFGHDK